MNYMCDHIGWLWNISSRYVCFLYVCTLSMTYSVTQEGPDVASMPTHDQPFESQICVYFPVTLCFHHYRVISVRLKDRPTLQTLQFFFSSGNSVTAELLTTFCSRYAWNFTVTHTLIKTVQ